MRTFLSAVLAVAVTACATDLPTVTESASSGGRVAAINDRATYVVVFRDEVADPPGKALGLAKQHRGSVTFTYTAALKGFAGAFSGADIADLARDPSVAYVERDQDVRAIATAQTPVTWGLDRIDQSTLPLDNAFTYTATGSGVTAYIIDTGILPTHAEFGGRASIGYDALGGGGIDCNGHGTHVAGTVGGSTYGVAKGVTLVAVRVLDCSGSGTTSGVIAGIDWVTSQKQAATSSGKIAPAVANMSLGGGASNSLDKAVNKSITSGVAYAVAAGNGNSAGVAQDACKYSPARVPAAMTIGATDKTDTKASWSNYGSCVDWFAPGVSITSAWIKDQFGNTSTTATAILSGTSMATPHTTGVAALYLSRKPSALPQEVRDSLFSNLSRGVVKNSNTTNNHLLYTNY